MFKELKNVVLLCVGIVGVLLGLMLLFLVVYCIMVFVAPGVSNLLSWIESIAESFWN